MDLKGKSVCKNGKVTCQHACLHPLHQSLYNDVFLCNFAPSLLFPEATDLSENTSLQALSQSPAERQICKPLPKELIYYISFRGSMLKTYEDAMR